MVDPTAQDVRRYLQVPESALPDNEFTGWLSDVKVSVTSTDRLVLIHACCVMIARSKNWHHVQRMGDKAFSIPDPAVHENNYRERCNQLLIDHELFGRKAAQMRKINTHLDDDPDDLNVDLV